MTPSLTRPRFARIAPAFAAAALFSALPAAAQDGFEGQRNIVVTGQGEAFGAPDMATVHVGVQTQAKTAAEAAEQNQAIVARIMAALEDEGIAEKDLQTADYSIWPEQRHDPQEANETTIIGYRVNNSVRVTVRDIDAVGAVLAAATDAGANSIHGVSFGIDDSAALEAEARKAAMADARQRAEDLAGLAGVTLGEVLQISLGTGGGYPVPMYKSVRMEAMDASAAPSVSAGELSVNVQLQVTWAIM